MQPMDSFPIDGRRSLGEHIWLDPASVRASESPRCKSTCLQDSSSDNCDSRCRALLSKTPRRPSNSRLLVDMSASCCINSRSLRASCKACCWIFRFSNVGPGTEVHPPRVREQVENTSCASPKPRTAARSTSKLSCSTNAFWSAPFVSSTRVIKPDRIFLFSRSRGEAHMSKQLSSNRLASHLKHIGFCCAVSSLCCACPALATSSRQQCSCNRLWGTAVPLRDAIERLTNSISCCKRSTNAISCSALYTKFTLTWLHTALARVANCKEDTVSSKCIRNGEQVVTRAVLKLPPSVSCNILVSLEFL
mmetsp:Transcript_12526/g.20637  ORF Transcript_12526/g.20637 Transcript_12526/m.20637 type:complete len:306 (-) Transcript_12526:1116-2033(-)